MPDKQFPAGFVPDGFEPDKPQSPQGDLGRYAGYKRLGDAVVGAAPKAVEMLPTIGGTIGTMLGGIPGAAIGGAIGAGARQIVQHGAELPGALADIARNWREAPSMARGAVSGTNAGAMDVGVNTGGQAALAGVGPALSAGASRLAPAIMQSALKPGIRSTLAATKSGTVPPVVNTLLKEGINVTPGGIEKLNGIIGASNVAIKDALASMPSTATISPMSVAGRLSPMARRAAIQVNPADDLATISQAGQEFLDAHGAQNLTPQAAQAMKTGTYRALGEKAYGELKGTAIESQKSLARGLKEEIEREAKAAGIDIGALNAREGAAITAKEAIAKRVAMVGNRDPAGLAWLAHSPVTFLMALAERSPVVKSYLARGLYGAAGQAAKVPAEAIRWAVGAVAAQQNQEPDQ